MSSHMGTIFLNSCFKVPIDPCSNCPAPIYNRPKVYLGRNTTSTSKVSTTSKLSEFDLDFDTLFSNNGVRSLVKFYDSIPDYCEINHLPEDEFYSTLETLRSTCRTLKSKSIVPTYVQKEICREYSGQSRKKKSTKKRSNSVKKETASLSVSPCVSSYRNLCERMRILNCKRFDDLEIEPLSGESIHNLHKTQKPLSVCHLPKEETKSLKDKEEKKENLKTPSKLEEKSLFRSNTANIRESLRKSFSFNDLNSTFWENEAKESLPLMNFKYTDNKTKSTKTNHDDVPKLNVQSPSSSDNVIGSSKPSSRGNASKKKTKTRTQSETLNVPFSFLGINDCKLSDKVSSASPVHPVARPNLAATLRVEASKKKVKELQNNCTFQNQTPQHDWEVRKTPAWKSLTLNESHKEILALRLATRKAEQALQQREYEKYMERMRQRVKSAPLLLESTTFWGPYVGKLSHSCHKDSLKHNCQRGKKTRKKCLANKQNHKVFHSHSNLYSRNSNNSVNSDELNSIDRAYL